MFKKFFIIIFFLFYNANAEIIKKIEINGNDRISSETILVYGEIKSDTDYDETQINEILNNLYETNFFKDIQIYVDSGILKIIVEEYPLINSVDLQGEESISIKKSILDKLFFKSRASFIENKLNEDINLIKNLYSSIGFNFVKVEAKIEMFSNNRVNLIFILNKGNKTNIKKINFIGDKKLKDKRLRDIIVSEESKFWKFLSKNTYLNNNTVTLDKRLLENYYKSIGYYDVQVISSNAEVSIDNSTSLTYSINAGKRYKIKKVSLNLSDVLDKKIFNTLENNFKKIIGNYYSPFKIKKLLDEVDLIIATNDLQFIEHSVNEILDENNIEVIINIYEGKKELIERVNIQGNTVTEESVIRSDLLLDEGDPFNRLKLEQSLAKLKARNIFGDVKVEILEGNLKDQKIIDIIVEEKPTGEISAGAGIGTSGGSLAFNISENNWLGKGLNVSTFLEVSSETFTGGLTVKDPNFNFSGNSLSYFLTNTKNDKPDSGFKNNVISLGGGTSFEQYRNVFIAPNLTYSYDDLKVQDSASESLKKQKGTFSDLSFDYSLSLDNRDRVYNPTDGYISIFRQSLPLYSEAPYVKNSYQLNKYKAINENMIGSIKFYASNVTGINEDVRLSKRNRLSSNQLRGFEAGKIGPKDGKDFVGGNYSASTNFELNLPNLLPESTKTDIGLFLDFGNVWGVDYDNSVDDSNKIRSTTGIAASWLSPAGPMSFIFSQNLSKASTDITESFNFRLGTTF